MIVGTKLDLPDDLELPHPDPAGGLDGSAVHLGDADEGVGEDRRDPEHHQGRRDVLQPEAEEGGGERDHGQLGDAAAGVAEGDGGALPAAVVAEQDAERQSHQQGGAEREKRDLDVLAAEVGHLVEPAHLVGLEAGRLRREDELDGVPEEAEKADGEEVRHRRASA